MESRDSLTITIIVVSKESTVQYLANSTFVRLLEQHCTCLNNVSIAKLIYMPTGINIIDRYAIPNLMGKNFFIPDYQRGYRWDKTQIFQLLSDIDLFRKYGKGLFYCLQPVIVKKCNPEFIAGIKNDDGSPLHSDYDDNTWYEVIDGQQRLTTIKIILTLNNLINPLQDVQNIYKIHYQTRPGLGKLFDSVRYEKGKFVYDVDVNSLDIDSYHVLQCLNLILTWFTEEGDKYEERSNKQQFPNFFGTFFGQKQDVDSPDNLSYEKSVQVLWYELKDATSPKAIFKRLNDSKIELTNSELIRALFLSESSDYKVDSAYKNNDDAKLYIRQRKQAHITEQWDIIEHQLRDPHFWAFATNNNEATYSCRIEYLFDLIAQKNIPREAPYKLNKRDERYTYLFFDRELTRTHKEDPKADYLWELWRKIETYYHTLKFWYEDRDLYHWIGYLIYIKGDNILPSLLKSASELGHDAFRIMLLEEIFGKEKKVGLIDMDLDILSYDDDYSKIFNVLMLYNIETYRKNKQMQFFPFKQCKDESWTLEHIHAQNSEGLPKDDNKVLLRWMEENVTAIRKFRMKLEKDSEQYKRSEDIINMLDTSIAKGVKKITSQEVSSHFDTVLEFYNSCRLSQGEPTMIHELYNLTLLSGSVNTAVGKSVFEVKRQMLVKMDAEGMFIPYCTKKVFMKYCNINDEDFEVQQTACWEDSDKVNYRKDIKSVIDGLKDILGKLMEEEETNNE